MLKIGLIAMTVLFSIQGWADLLIEPYVGYASGSGETSNQGDSYKHKYTGALYGGRLGVKTLGLMVGLDYSMQNVDLKTTYTSDSSTTTDKIKRDMGGLFVGYEFPILFRVWATYYFLGSTKGQDSSSNTWITNQESYKSPSGYSLGFGYKLLPILSLNAEYRTINYGTYDAPAAYKAYGAYTEKFNLNEVVLSVSLPLSI